MTDSVDWTLLTWEGNRRQQHRDFAALSFREKMEAVEAMAAVAERLGNGRAARGTAAPGKQES